MLLNKLNPSLAGWAVVAIMLVSGLVLGTVSDRLLRFLGVGERKKRR
jgi:uncharacterized membrane-anchored protein YhcB (DUF1043 family)